MRRLVFIVVSGNEDAHKKNFSLRYEDGRQARLAPAYDLVSTVQYDLVRGLGLSLGGSRRFADLGIHSFDKLAQRVGVEVAVTRRFVVDQVDRTCDTLRAYLEQMPDPALLREHMRAVPLVRA